MCCLARTYKKGTVFFVLSLTSLACKLSDPMHNVKEPSPLKTPPASFVTLPFGIRKTLHFYLTSNVYHMSQISFLLANLMTFFVPHLQKISVSVGQVVRLVFQTNTWINNSWTSTFLKRNTERNQHI